MAAMAKKAALRQYLRLRRAYRPWRFTKPYPWPETSDRIMNIHEFEQLLLAQIDAIVAKGSDDELFASGYLRGHVSLAVANCEIHGKTLVRDVEMNVLRSLQQACLNGELNDQDQRLVEEMWQQLLKQAKSTLAAQ